LLDICGPAAASANGTATTAAAVVAMRAKRIILTLQVEIWLLSSPSSLHGMPRRGALDASLPRFQADIDIRYALSIVNVNLSKFDTLRKAPRFARWISSA
jgi:hypothetical protein